jgi:putative tricarboxylic transport membrane protein
MIGVVGEAVSNVLSWPTVFWLAFGVVVGVIIGAIPGIGPNIGIAILIPLSLSLTPTNAIIFFVCLYAGSLYGGCIPAILMNAPGTAAAGASTLDGYPLSQEGRAQDALGVSVSASAIGGFLTSVVLILITPFLIDIVLAFGSPEYFLVAALGLALIAVVAAEDILRGLASGTFGMILSTVGTAPMALEYRYTLGIRELNIGISFVAVLIGVFALSEMFKLTAQEKTQISETSEFGGRRLTGMKIALKSKLTLIKSSVIGMVIGAMPGSGSSIANFIAYGEAQRSSNDPESFGSGNTEGLVASESSNNSVVAGSLIPTFAFGIPGSGSTAVLLGALILHGLQPGPNLFTSDVQITYSVFVALVFANILIFIVGIVSIRYLSLVTKIDLHYIVSIVIVLTMVGTLALRNNWIDVATVALFGLIGLIMSRNGYSIVALVLGVVLGPIAESNLHRSLQLHDSFVEILYSSNITIILTVLIVITILSGPISSL